MTALLTILNGEAAGERLTLRNERVVIGRQPDCDVVLRAESISRHHACIFRRQNSFYLEDLGSRNGTYLNGQRIHTATRLTDGDHIQLYEVTLTYSDRDRKAGPRTPVPVRPAAAEIAHRNPALSETLAEIDLRKFEQVRRHINAEMSLKAVIEITRGLQTWIDVDEVLNRILDSLFRIFPQLDRGCILLVEETLDDLQTAAIRHRADVPGQSVTMRPIRQSVARHVIAEGKAILSVEAADDVPLRNDTSVLEMQSRSYMCAPLISASGRALGALFVDTDESGVQFSTDDLDVLACVAFLAGQAVDQATLQTKRYRAVVDTAVDGIITTNDAGTIESVNPALQRLLGYRPDELISRSVECIIPAAEAAQSAPFAGILQNPDDSRVESVAQRKDGSTVPVYLSVGRFQLHGREHFTGILHDITEQKRAEEKLKQLNESLERRVHKRTEHIRLLQDVAVIANEAESVGRAFYAALERIREYLNWPVGHTYLRSADDPLRLVDTGVWSFDEPGRYRDLVRETRGGIENKGLRIVDQVFSTGQAEWVENIAEKTELVRFGVLNDVGLKTVFAVPILMGDQVVGVFEFFSNEAKRPEPAFLNLMKHVGTQLGRVVERRHLQNELIDAVWFQQRRFGQELHDSLGQELTGIGMMTQSLARKLAAQKRPEAGLVAEIAEMIQHAKQEARQLAKGMFPVEVDAEGLRAALEELAETTRERYEIDCVFLHDRNVDIRDNNVATHLFRIAQEAVTNAIKHSETSRLELSLTLADAVPLLTVSDDGKGVAERDLSEPEGMGLRIMKYRANAIGGELSVQRGPHGGTCVKCLVQGENRK